MTEQTPSPTKNQRAYKVLAVDLDGTLLNSKHEVSEANQKALQAAKEAGIQIIIATGKTYSSSQTLRDTLKLNTPGIYTQGLTVYDSNGNLRHQQTLDAEVVRRVITFAEDRGFAVVAYAQGRILARSSNPYIEELHTRWHDTKPQYVGTLQNLLDTTQFNKLVLISAGDERKMKALRWQLATQLASSARLLSAGISHMLEILPNGASKGNALRALLKEMNVDPQDVIAVGDAENDTEMLQLAGLGIAVGNATASLKAVAKEITVSNDEDAIAQVIYKYLVKPAPAPEPVPPPTSDTPVSETVTPPAESPAPEDTSPSTPPAESKPLAPETGGEA
ncbi:MAG: HAD family hydrolase [Phototrophicaceae bacterium]